MNHFTLNIPTLWEFWFVGRPVRHIGARAPHIEMEIVHSHDESLRRAKTRIIWTGPMQGVMAQANIQLLSDWITAGAQRFWHL